MKLLAVTKLGGPDYFIIVAYFVLMLSIGVYFYRYMKGMKEYFTGGNQIPWWLSGVSFYIASFSAFAFVSYSSLAYKYGWVAVTLFWVTVPATLVGVMFFASHWRRARVHSPVEYLESRYGLAVRQLFAWQGVPVKLIDDALKLVATGTFVSVGLGLDLKQSMFWCGAIMLAYTFMGGLWAVAVTDFIQFVVLAVAVIILLPLSIAKVGGVSGFFNNAPPGFFKLTSPEYSWLFVGATVVIYCLSYSSINWALVQRYYCVPTEKDARKAGWLVVVLNIIGPPIMYIPAMCAAQFLPGLEKDIDVYPTLCATLLPVGMMGLMIAGMFSATMSTLSSDYNVCASVLTNDVYRRLIRRNASQKELVLVGRITTLIAGVLSMGAAFYMVGSSGEQLFRTMVTLFSIAVAPVAIPMLAGLVSHRVSNAGALVGFVTGLIVGLLVFKFGPEEGILFGLTWKGENLVVVCASLATLIPMLIVSGLVPPGQAETVRVHAFLHRLNVPIGQLPEDKPAATANPKDVISPFRVVGILTALIGVMMLCILPWVPRGTERLAFELDLFIGLLLIGLGLFSALRLARLGTLGKGS